MKKPTETIKTKCVCERAIKHRLNEMFGFRFLSDRHENPFRFVLAAFDF